MAAESGFEPEQNESESFVLPLHNHAMAESIIRWLRHFVKSFSKNFLDFYREKRNYLLLFPDRYAMIINAVVIIGRFCSVF